MRALEFYLNNVQFKEGKEVTVNNITVDRLNEVLTIEVSNG